MAKMKRKMKTIKIDNVIYYDFQKETRRKEIEQLDREITKIMNKLSLNPNMELNKEEEEIIENKTKRYQNLISEEMKWSDIIYE